MNNGNKAFQFLIINEVVVEQFTRVEFTCLFQRCEMDVFRGQGFVGEWSLNGGKIMSADSHQCALST